MDPSDQADSERQEIAATPTDSGRLTDDEQPTGRIGWKKALVIIVAVGGLYVIVEHVATTGPQIPWLNDLATALQQAQNPRKAVVLLIHKRDCPVMAEVEQTVFNLRSTYNWAMGGVPCRLIWEEHPDLVAKYHLTESPTLLCLSPEGEVVFQNSGYGITPQIIKRFLKYTVGAKDEGTYRKAATLPSATQPQ
jgi:hypothetical protein